MENVAKFLSRVFIIKHYTMIKPAKLLINIPQYYYSMSALITGFNQSCFQNSKISQTSFQNLASEN
jgi:hypothetical protein